MSSRVEEVEHEGVSNVISHVALDFAGVDCAYCCSNFETVGLALFLAPLSRSFLEKVRDVVGLFVCPPAGPGGRGSKEGKRRP